MKVPIPDHEIVSVVELLTAMADFCRAEAPVIGVALPVASCQNLRQA